MTTTARPPDSSTALSTQPAPPDQLPVRRRFAPVIRAWRRLTSMRTALILLFLLALAAVPGSLLPQRALNPTKVNNYLAAHPTIGPLLDRASFFDVFGSPWFAAIYLLLFVSLLGCLAPRIRLHARALRGAPPKAPKHFTRLPESTSYDLEATPQEAADSAAARLRKERWRVVTRTEDDGAVTVSAEKGYLRETGNLLFHVSLTVLLIAVAVGRLWGYSGTVLVQDGGGFCNTVQQFDSFRSGQLTGPGALAPFCMNLKKFSATYDSHGTAEQFTADITYNRGLTGRERKDVLRVNHPLRIEGLRLYLLGHGFSGRFTVHEPHGHVVRVTQPFLPQDANFSSQGAVKLPDAQPTGLAMDGLLLPTAAATSADVLTSIWPQADNPAVALFFYQGNLGLDDGVPQSVYSLDQHQLATGALKRVGQANLRAGQSYTLPDGTRVTFDGVSQWASLQVSRDPAQTVVLGAAVGIVLGLLLSLRVRRRRVWLRVRHPAGAPPDLPAGDSRTVVAVGGLARTDAGAFHEEFTRIAQRLHGRG